MNRIDQKFERLRSRGQQAFIPYLTAGDPDLDSTLEIVLAMEDAGADIVELGVPFSDPIADGPVIQRATERALNSGTSVESVLDLVRRIRSKSEIPLVLMSYYNPLLNQGLTELAHKASDAGLDGILATDLTVEESKPFVDAMRGASLSSVFLVAPTSPDERVEKIARRSTGFLYAVSRTGVTGATHTLSDELVGFIRRLRQHTDRPLAVGFGISGPEHVRAVWKEADAAIVGSAIVQRIEQRLGQSDMAAGVGELIRWMRGPQLAPEARRLSQ